MHLVPIAWLNALVNLAAWDITRHLEIIARLPELQQEAPEVLIGDAALLTGVASPCEKTQDPFFFKSDSGNLDFDRFHTRNFHRKKPQTHITLQVYLKTNPAPVAVVSRQYLQKQVISRQETICSSENSG